VLKVDEINFYILRPVDGKTMKPADPNAAVGFHMADQEQHVALVLIAFWLVTWFAFAAPTARFARFAGHPWWIAYLIWFPFWVPYVRPILFRMFPILAEQQATSFLSWVFYLTPGIIYWWIVALSKPQRNGNHADPTLSVGVRTQAQK
jgi:hypothetical protein